MALLFVSLVAFLSLSLSGAVDWKLSPTEGKICAFADFNRDKYTDLLVVSGTSMFVRVQDKDGNGEFSDGGRYLPTKELPADFKESNVVSCAVGDFDGDSQADILITRRISDRFLEVYVCYLQSEAGFNCSKSLGKSFVDQPIVFDVDADGISDVLAFVEEDNPLKCFQGQNGLQNFIDCSDAFKEFKSTPYTNFAHAFVDIDGDLSADLVFGVKAKDSKDKADLSFEVWKREIAVGHWKVAEVAIIGGLPADAHGKTFGQPTYGDINADGKMDILLPICATKECTSIDLIVWERALQWSNKISIDIGATYSVASDNGDPVQLRLGDFDLDGFPDLITVLVDKKGNTQLYIIKNVACDSPTCETIKRSFKLEEKERLVEGKEISGGTKVMATFFDLREDGSLDILVEYKTNDKTYFDFIPCEDKGDTTFLKVEVFTKICYDKCKHKGDGPNSYGSSISWHGTTLSFIMSDTSGEQRHGVQTQLAQTSHRTLPLPFATFGLGRTPNFVDTLTVGTPAYPNPQTQTMHWPQLVPNSRIYIIPPGPDKSSWTSRLYMTPSRLIIQSLTVLVAVCGIIIVIIAFLHWRERRQDQVERQAQAHRFHFDAM